LVALVAAAFIVAGPVAAQGDCELEVTPLRDAPDDGAAHYTIHASGFTPDETVTFQLFFAGEPFWPEPEVRTIDRNGEWDDHLAMLPEEEPLPGEYTLRVRGNTCTAEATFTFMPDTAIEAAAQTPAQASWAIIGALLIGAMTLVYLVRRPVR
jgi:hypothetical protein